jgi:hypothetical protein
LATVASGVNQVINDVADTNLPEENVFRTASKEVGKVIGGEKGEKVGAFVYDIADTAATAYSIIGGSATVVQKTATALGKTAKITKINCYLFNNPSIFMNRYYLSVGANIEKAISLPKTWFKIFNGIGAGVDTARSSANIFGW